MFDVAVTGLGVLSALGRGVPTHLEALRGGRCGLKLPLKPAPGFPLSPVGEVDLPGGSGRCISLALAAGAEALQGRSFEGPGGIFVGTTTGGISESEQHYLASRRGEPAPDRGLLRHHSAGTIADGLAHRLRVSCERYTFSTACSSSLNAVGYAACKVQGGMPWALAGGVDSLCQLTSSGFQALKLLATDACRPFDRDRRGLCLGEAAAFLLLEPGPVARRHPEAILGYVRGWGSTADAHHMTAPDPEGRGAARAMDAALREAGIPLSAVDYIHAHGTGTPANDLAEATAIRTLFGEHHPWVSSTKGATGHTLGAAGALGAVFSLLSLSSGFLPGTVGLREVDPAIKLRSVPREGIDLRVTNVLCNAFGFGGNNAALAFSGPHP